MTLRHAKRRPRRLDGNLRRLRETTHENAWRVRILVERLCKPAVPAAGISLPSKSDNALRLFTLNMAHGRNKATHQAFLKRHRLERHLEEIADTVRGLDVDVLGLQEADGPSAWSGNFDHVATLAERAELSDFFHGDHNRFGFGRFNVTSGTALLARLPLSDRRSEPFRSNWRDTKGFVVATVEVPAWGGMAIDLVSLHLDFLRPKIRRRQIQGLVTALAGRQRPRVVLGDLNCSWHLEPRSMQYLSEELDLRAYAPHSLTPTYPSARPRFRFDWILISRELDFTGYRRVDTQLSDHLGVVADLCAR
jgi:endonuclease/exonuclease/phosphatase family metal-dependent hydrolase